MSASTLALKHRSEKKLRQRVVMFVGSPIDAEPKEIDIFGAKVRGWIITTEEPAIDKIIPLDESTQGEVLNHDPE